MLSKFTVTFFFDERDFVTQELLRESEGAVLYEVSENMNKRFFGFRDSSGHWVEVVSEKVRRFRVAVVWTTGAATATSMAVPAS